MTPRKAGLIETLIHYAPIAIAFGSLGVAAAFGRAVVGYLAESAIHQQVDPLQHDIRMLRAEVLYLKALMYQTTTPKQRAEAEDLARRFQQEQQ